MGGATTGGLDGISGESGCSSQWSQQSIGLERKNSHTLVEGFVCLDDITH